LTSAYFTYNKGKVIQALRYHFISRREIKVMMILVNVYAIISAILFYSKVISPLAFLLSSALWFILMLLFWFLLPRIIYRKASVFKDRLRTILSANYFEIENNKGSRSWEWKEFSTWIESPHFFHLYFNSRSFFIIPKEAFEGDNEHEARKIFKASIGNRESAIGNRQ
jgi:hypothetical protein